MNTNNEEKKENDLVDSNQTHDINPEGKPENNPFDSDDSLDIGQEENNETTPADEKQSKTIKTIVIVVLLLLPIAYIFYKTAGNPASTPEQATNQAQTIDIAAYESVANATPSFSNLLNLSNAYINSGMAGKAIEPLKKAIELNPESAIAYSNLGFAYTIIQQYKKGIEFGQKAVQLDSTFQLAKDNLNWALTEQNKLLQAIAEVEKTPEDKRNTDFYIMYGLQYLKLQDYDKSIEIWDKVLAKDPKNSAALINIGVAYMSKSQYADAIKSFQKAVDANANDQLAKNNLAWALDEQNKVLAEKSKAEALQKK
ncbi:MAG: tetratricopeptide repeat protein [Bacteroidota bacterium]|nr:tetratricopeptide repeat protein [Bacteroidota bacterium]